MAPMKTDTAAAQSSATIGFEAKLWLTADKLRNNMDATEFKHVALDLISLKYALLGQPPYSTQIPVRFWFSGKNEPAGKCRATSELTLTA